MFGDDAIRPYAYTYRDYVIRAFNEDVPYDRFIVDQLAADQVDAPERPVDQDDWRLAAMGFLTLGGCSTTTSTTSTTTASTRSPAGSWG